MTAMVETVNLSKHFGSIRAVNDLSFTVGKGEVLGFLGPNGAGKSTTMKMLTCFATPTGGTARVCGLDILDEPIGVRERVGYLPETAPAYGEMSVRDFLAFVARVRGMVGTQLDRAVATVVEKCRLESVLTQPFETLSKGFKRRTCLAQALIHDPPVLILDEPTDGLDPNQKHEVRRLISEMSEDKCIILSTHILEEVDAVCTRAVIIDQGKLVVDCTPEELRRKSPRHGAVDVAFEGVEIESALEQLEKLDGSQKVETFEWEGISGFRIYPEGDEKLAPRIAHLANEAGWEMKELHIERGQLDEVFRLMTTEEGGLTHE